MPINQQLTGMLLIAIQVCECEQVHELLEKSLTLLVCKFDVFWPLVLE